MSETTVNVRFKTKIYFDEVEGHPGYLVGFLSPFDLVVFAQDKESLFERAERAAKDLMWEYKARGDLFDYLTECGIEYQVEPVGVPDVQPDEAQPFIHKELVYAVA